MAFFDDVISVLQAAIVLIGIGTAIVGGILFGQAYTSDDATKKSTGINTVIGGIIVAVIGFTLVPKIKDFIPTIHINTLIAIQYFRMFL